MAKETFSLLDKVSFFMKMISSLFYNLLISFFINNNQDSFCSLSIINIKYQFIIKTIISNVI
ncbi:hypothetical protein C4Z11_004250 [Proteus mirabilis]|nr:hypothetical protein C4Z11_004250 [Proteus mirabilis]